MIQRKKMDFSEDQFILTNILLSTELCKEVLHVMDPNYFASKAIKIIISWAKNHYSKYGECLGVSINDYYEINASNFEPSVKEQIGNILENLSNVMDNEIHNIPYLKERALTLFRRRHGEQRIRAANKFLDSGDVDNAEKALAERFNYTDLVSNAKRLDDKDLLAESIGSIYRDKESNPFFKFSGRFGEFIGEIDRNWLVCFTAPAKIGKTSFLIETLIQAIMQGRSIFFLSFEMPLGQVNTRILKSITGLNTPKGGEYYVPVFDCLKNQTAECTSFKRTGYGSLIRKQEGEVEIPVFDPEKQWKVCTACRGTKDFIPSTWKTKVVKPSVSEQEFKKKVNAFMQLYSKNCKSVFYPSKTCRYSDILRELEALEQRDNFVPDIILCDYIDLMANESDKGKYGDTLAELDSSWEAFRAIEQGRHCTVITASQTNRLGVGARFVDPTTIGSSWAKMQKMDLGIGLAQTEDMKEANSINVNIIASRHSSFIVSKVCTVLQDSDSGQYVLDSEF